MASSTKPSTTYRFADADERERFKRAAKHEGFDDLQAWMSYHLRRQCKSSLEEAKAEEHSARSK